MLVLTMLAMVSACTNAAASSATGGSLGAESGHVSDLSAGGAAAPASGGSTSSGGASAQKAPADRSVTVTGSMDLRSAHPIAAATLISQLVTAGGGTVADLNEQPNRQASADLTVRIPAASFTRVLDAIKKEGAVTNLSVQETDVTSQVTDYAVRISTLRQSITRLQALLARATTSTDLVQIETTLEQRQTQLEQLLAQQKNLSDQVEYATVSISIVSPTAPIPTTQPTNFVGGFVAGLLGLASTASFLAVILGVILPWAVVLGIIASAVLFGVRLVRRRAAGRASAST